jgi:hypothetical protein
VSSFPESLRNKHKEKSRQFFCLPLLIECQNKLSNLHRNRETLENLEERMLAEDESKLKKVRTVFFFFNGKIVNLSCSF